MAKLYGASEALTSLNFSTSGTGYLMYPTTGFLPGFLSQYPAYKWRSYGEPISVTCTKISSSPDVYTLEVTTSKEVLSIPGLSGYDMTTAWGLPVSSNPTHHGTFSLTPSYSWQTREVAKTYGSVGELTSISGTIRSGGDGNISAFDGTTFLAKLKSTSYTKGYEYADGEYGEIDFLRVYVVPGPYYMISFHTKNDKSRNNGYGMSASSLANWGITAIQNPSMGGVGDYIDVSTVYSPKSKQIKKFYGSVNGQTKLIHQA